MNRLDAFVELQAGFGEAFEIVADKSLIDDSMIDLGGTS
jgi:hypothetical protein